MRLFVYESQKEVILVKLTCIVKIWKRYYEKDEKIGYDSEDENTSYQDAFIAKILEDVDTTTTTATTTTTTTRKSDADEGVSTHIFYNGRWFCW